MVPNETTTYSLPDSPFARDPDFTQSLIDYGVLHILRPEQLMDKEAAEALHQSLLELLASPGSVLRSEKREDRELLATTLPRSIARGAGCPSEGFVGSHCRAPTARVSRAPSLA